MRSFYESGGIISGYRRTFGPRSRGFKDRFEMHPKVFVDHADFDTEFSSE